MTEEERVFGKAVQEASDEAVRTTLLGLLLILDHELIGGQHGTAKELAVFAAQGLKSHDEIYLDNPDASITAFEAALLKNTQGPLTIDELNQS